MTQCGPWLLCGEGRRTLDYVLSSDAGGAASREDARAVVFSLMRRVIEERRRAARAAGIAASYEARSADRPEHLRALRVRMASLYRRTEERHRASAALHELHAARMTAWLNGERGQGLQPVFMSAVAAAIGVSSATATVRGRRPAAVVAASSDATARAAHDLEVTLGEGPAVAAVAERTLIRADGPFLAERWPLYGPAVEELGVHAVIGIPLQLSTACFGALCVYETEPVIRDEVAAATGRIADVLTHTVLLPPEGLGFGGYPEPLLFSEADYQAVVHQAAGVVAVRCGCGIDDAEALLRARAFADGQPVEDIARSVLRGETRLW